MEQSEQRRSSPWPSRSEEPSERNAGERSETARALDVVDVVGLHGRDRQERLRLGFQLDFFFMLSIGFKFSLRRSTIVFSLLCFPSSVFAPRKYEAAYAPRAERGIFTKFA